MNIKQLISQAKAASPDLAPIPDDACRELLQAAFRTVRKTVAMAPEGDVEIGGLGIFRVQSVERERDGQAVAARRVTFVPAVAAAGKTAPRKAAARKSAGRVKPAVKRPAVKAAARKAAAKKAARKTAGGARTAMTQAVGKPT